jgi:hypothetical protein
MREINTHSDSFERGRQQAAATRDLAMPYLERLRSRTLNCGIDPIILRIERLTPLAYQECCGIAAGIGWRERDYFAAALGVTPMSCTAISVIDPVLGPVIGKTDDIAADERGMNVVEHCQPSEGYRHVHAHFACTVWTTAGMNEHGLGIAMTGIPGPRRIDDGVPSLFPLREILLRCADVQHAIEYLRGIPLCSYGYSLQLADATGRRELIEVTSAGFAKLTPLRELWLIHTNHVLDRHMAERCPSQEQKLDGNSRRRIENLLQHIAGISVAGREAVVELIGHRTGDGAMTQNGEDGLYTDYTVVLTPSRKVIDYWGASPHT